MKNENNSIVKYKEFGLRVREARKNKRLTMYELSEKINITENFLARIESNNGKAGLGTIVKICNELNISMDYLFQDSLHEMNVETLNIETLNEPDKKFIIKTIKNLKAYRNELDGYGFY